ncbi:hypothetical protein BCR37DRAFT_41159 [Protomyces lactucae-debilis]|uniref:Uncharacterized protein n=1 Tax=Protomyces lactucae-debilis TaxID=2754530 RepID=A0A1Y2FBS3_PROLT|nr:uncharacterized protein BCR37DRAFT_41159 [Protomyces lactucae-debilis]ORY81341.1 hypothetical protein BCR37DRAFT_41159 [Protomyces lactucae-debilis]
MATTVCASPPCSSTAVAAPGDYDDGSEPRNEVLLPYWCDLGYNKIGKLNPDNLPSCCRMSKVNTPRTSRATAFRECIMGTDELSILKIPGFAISSPRLRTDRSRGFLCAPYVDSHGRGCRKCLMSTKQERGISEDALHIPACVPDTISGVQVSLACTWFCSWYQLHDAAKLRQICQR